MQPCIFNWDTHKIWVQRITFNQNSSLVPVSLQPCTHLHKSHQKSHFNHNRHKNYFLLWKVFVASSLECFSLMLSEMINWRYVFLSGLRPSNDGSFELQGWEHCFPTERERDGLMQCLMLVLELPLKLPCIITPLSLRRTWLMNCYCLSLHTNFCLKIDSDKIPETERVGEICNVHSWWDIKFCSFHSFDAFKQLQPY